MAEEGNASAEEEQGDSLLLEKMCEDILERRLREARGGGEEAERRPSVCAGEGGTTAVPDAGFAAELAMSRVQRQLDELSRSDLRERLGKEQLWGGGQGRLFSYPQVQRVLHSIHSCKKAKATSTRLSSSGSRGANIRDCVCGFCKDYGRYLLYGLSLCPVSPDGGRRLGELRSELCRVSRGGGCFEGRDVLAVFLNWGLNADLLDGHDLGDLRLETPTTTTTTTTDSTTSTTFGKENWNEVLRSLLPVLDSVRFQSGDELRTLLKVLLVVSVGEEGVVRPSYCPHLEPCLRRLQARLGSHGEDLSASLVRALNRRGGFGLYARVALAEKLDQPLASSLALAIMRDHLGLLATDHDDDVTAVSVPQLYAVLEGWRPLEMSLKEIYFLVKCLRMCVGGLPAADEEDKWEFLRHAERWLDELKVRMRLGSVDSVNVQYYVSQVVADWYRKYPAYLRSLAQTSPLYR